MTGTALTCDRTVGVDASVLLRVTAVVPVKPLALAKTRLALPARQRYDLVLAFALDTVAALAGCPLVSDIVVVTSDPVVARRMRGVGVRVVRDDASGLDGAVRTGVRAAASDDAGVAVVPADLPCLRPTDVSDVLAAASETCGAYVPDRSGSGTTFVVHPQLRRIRTSYGPGSAARHAALGLTALLDAPVGARHDVDTLDDLDSAIHVGTGPATFSVIAASGLALTDIGW